MQNDYDNYYTNIVTHFSTMSVIDLAVECGSLIHTHTHTHTLKYYTHKMLYTHKVRFNNIVCVIGKVKMSVMLNIRLFN